MLEGLATFASWHSPKHGVICEWAVWVSCLVAAPAGQQLLLCVSACRLALLGAAGCDQGDSRPTQHYITVSLVNMPHLLAVHQGEVLAPCRHDASSGLVLQTQHALSTGACGMLLCSLRVGHDLSLLLGVSALDKGVGGRSSALPRL